MVIVTFCRRKHNSKKPPLVAPHLLVALGHRGGSPFPLGLTHTLLSIHARSHTDIYTRTYTYTRARVHTHSRTRTRIHTPRTPESFRSTSFHCRPPKAIRSLQNWFITCEYQQYPYVIYLRHYRNMTEYQYNTTQKHIHLLHWVIHHVSNNHLFSTPNYILEFFF